MPDVVLAAVAASVFMILAGAVLLSILFEHWNDARKQKYQKSEQRNERCAGPSVFRAMSVLKNDTLMRPVSHPASRVEL